MTEERFTLSEKDLLDFLDLTPDPILAQRGGLILFVNQAFVQAMRASAPMSFIGRRLLDIIAPADHEMVIRNIRDSDPRASRSPADVRALRADGSQVIFQFAGMRVGDRSNPISLFVCREVTAERARAEEQRRIDEERRLLFEGGPIAVAHTNTEGRYLHANRAMCELFGYTLEELCQRSYLDHTHPDDRMLELRALRSLWAGAPRAKINKRLLHRSGEILHVSVHLSLMREADGEPRGYISHILDNSAELKAEEGRRLAEASLRTIFNGASTGLGITSLGAGRGFFQRVNPAVCAMLGYSEEEMLTLPLTHFTDPVDAASDVNSMDLAQLRVGEQYRTLKRYRTRDGRQIMAERFVSIVGGAPGKPDAAVVQVTDVTARIATEKALRESEMLHRQVLQNLPHLATLHFDRELRYTLVEGDEMLERLGFKPADMIGKTVREFAKPDVASALEDRYARTLAGEKIRWQHERDGHFYECRGTPLRDEQGEITGGLIVVYETSELVAARQELAALIGASGRAADISGGAQTAVG